MPSRAGSRGTAEPHGQTLLQGSWRTVITARPEPGNALTALGPSRPPLHPIHQAQTRAQGHPLIILGSIISLETPWQHSHIAKSCFQCGRHPCPLPPLSRHLLCPAHHTAAWSMPQHPCPGSRHGHHIQGPALAPGMLSCTKTPRMLSKLWARVTTCSYPSPLCTAEMPMDG